MGYFNSVPDENIWIDKIMKWVIDIIVVVLAAIMVITFFGDTIKMDGKSMESVINSGDYMLINKFSYQFTSPKRYDIIAFTDHNGEPNIKRIVGLPGEKVQIRGGIIYIDGKKLDMDYGKETIFNAGNYDKENTIGAGEYFVFGDNFNSSEDSRFGTIGLVKSEDIIGKPWIRVAPISRIGLIR